MTPPDELPLTEPAPARVAPFTLPEEWATVTLIALNALAFAVCVVINRSLFTFDPEIMIRLGVDYGPRTTHGEWWRLLTAIFLHYGLIHIAMNMYVFYDIGRLIERFVGARAFLIVYLLAGLTGSLFSLAHHPQSAGAGASGAIFGLYGVLLALLVRHRRSFTPEGLRRLGKGALIFVVLNILIAWRIPFIDQTAHLGGLAGGFFFGWFLSLRIPGEPPPREGLRDFLIAMGGLLLIVLGASRLPKAPDYQATLKQFGELEERLDTRYNEAVGRFKTGSSPDGAAFAREIETNIIPQWQSACQTLHELDGLTDRQLKVNGVLLRYCSARISAYRALAKAAPNDDAAAIAEYKKHEAEAQTLLKELSADEGTGN